MSKSCQNVKKAFIYKVFGVFLVAILLQLAFGRFLYAGEGLVITKLQIGGGTGRTLEDFIVIQNFSASDIDLAGYKIVKRTASSKSDSVIFEFESGLLKSGEEIIWANNKLKEKSFIADYFSDGYISDDNGVALKKGNTLFSAFSFGKADNGYPKVLDVNPKTGEYIEYDNLSGGYKLGGVIDGLKSLSVVSAVQEVHQKENIVINELLIDPEGDDVGKERVELYNPSDGAYSLDGFYLADEGAVGDVARRHYLPSVYINARSYVVVDLPKDVFVLDNKGDSIMLYNKYGQVVDRVKYINSVLGLSYQKVSNNFIFSPATFGVSNTDRTGKGLVVNEIYVSDGQSYIELLNGGSTVIDLVSIKIFVYVEKKLVKQFDPSKDYLLPGELLVYELSEDDKGLPGGDFVIQVVAGGEVVDSVVVERYHMGLSYVKKEGGFIYDKPSKGVLNNFDYKKLFITEVVSVGGEVVEFYNASDIEIDLSIYNLKFKSGVYKITGVVPPRAYYSLDLKNKLYNEGGGFALQYQDEVLQTIDYPKLLKNQSWSFIDSQWVVTESQTLGAENIYKSPDEEIKEAPAVSSKVYGISAINKLLKENGLVKKDLAESQKALGLITNKFATQIGQIEESVKASADSLNTFAIVIFATSMTAIATYILTKYKINKKHHNEIFSEETA